MRFGLGDGNCSWCGGWCCFGSGCNCENSRGNVLPLVLGVLLVLSVLLSAMLRMPGTLRRTVAMVADETQEMYWAESAVLAKLEGFPEMHFAGLPAVESRVLGPWTEWRTVKMDGGRVNKFQFMLGNAYSRF